MNGRFFGGKKIEATICKEFGQLAELRKQQRKESGGDSDEEKRLENFASWLES